MNDAAGALTAIRMLIISSSRDQTEKFTTSLRNGGLAVHSQRIPNTDDLELLEDQLRKNECDLILCCSYEGHIDSRPVQNALDDLDKDIPLVIITDDNADPDALIQAMRDGAKDLVDRHDLEHLQLVVAREFSALQTRRELITLKQRLQESDLRSMGLIESSQEPIAFVQDGMHVHVNPAYVSFFGFDEASDIQDLPLLDMIDKQSRDDFRRGLKKLESESSRRSYNLDTKLRLQDGGQAEATLHLSKASMEGESCLQVMIRLNRPDTREIQQKLESSGQVSAKSELPNRQFFLGQLDQWLDTSVDDGKTRAVVYLGVDHIPELRETLGLNRTEEAMLAVADKLRHGLEPSDVLTRFNDTTFTLLMARPGLDDLKTAVQSFCASVASMDIDGIAPATGPSCSIGVSLIEAAHSEAQSLVNEAYRASETAREQGGNRVIMLHETQSSAEAGAQDGKILGLIENALARDRFHLVYQPIVSLQGDTRENYTVLVRMRGDDDEEIMPEFFLKQAEQYGKMVEIDHWIIREAIAQVSGQRKEGRKANFFVTLSEPSLHDKNTLLWICDCLREFDARGGWLTFQIREKHAHANLKAVAKLVDGLKKIKCQIALDHFGLHEQPELILNDLKIDFAKLAPSFVREIHNNQEKQDELNDLNALIHKHGVKTIATAVEDANSLTVLWTVGIGYIQGYFLQEPSETIEYNQQLI